jgi:hypothetical protein
MSARGVNVAYPTTGVIQNLLILQGVIEKKIIQRDKLKPAYFAGVNSYLP